MADVRLRKIIMSNGVDKATADIEKIENNISSLDSSTVKLDGEQEITGKKKFKSQIEIAYTDTTDSPNSSSIESILDNSTQESGNASGHDYGLGMTLKSSEQEHKPFAHVGASLDKNNSRNATLAVFDNQGESAAMGVVSNSQGKYAYAPQPQGVSDDEIATTKYVKDNIPTLDNVVKTTGDQNVEGIKIFTTLPQSSATPTDEKDLITKKYFDENKGTGTGGGDIDTSNLAKLDQENTFTIPKANLDGTILTPKGMVFKRDFTIGSVCSLPSDKSTIPQELKNTTLPFGTPDGVTCNYYASVTGVHLNLSDSLKEHITTFKNTLPDNPDTKFFYGSSTKIIGGFGSAGLDVAVVSYDDPFQALDKEFTAVDKSTDYGVSILNALTGNSSKVWATNDLPISAQDLHVIGVGSDKYGNRVSYVFTAPVNSDDTNIANTKWVNYKIKEKTGDLTQLTTTNKDNLVNAINEIKQNNTGGGTNVYVVENESDIQLSQDGFYIIKNL